MLYVSEMHTLQESQNPEKVRCCSSPVQLVSVRLVTQGLAGTLAVFFKFHALF